MGGEIFSMVLKSLRILKKTTNNRVLDHLDETSKSIPVPEPGNPAGNPHAGKRSRKARAPGKITGEKNSGPGKFHIRLVTVINKIGICRDLDPAHLSVPQRPEPRACHLSASGTLLNTPSSIPIGEQRFIPARFRVFANYDL
jgi:hypothetical protein